jgi:diguanylate cyclase (GGDEF)-like protein
LVDDRSLSSVLGDFALTLADGLRTTSVLDELARRAVELLPVSSAGVSLLEPGHPGDEPGSVAAYDDLALRLQKVQVDAGDGPCVLAFETGEPVAVPDLRAEHRFPQLRRAAGEEGIDAVFTFPLGRGSRHLGALALYRREAGDLEAREADAAQMLADVAAAYVVTAQGHEQTVLGSERLQHLATHDALTGLPNRRLLLERLEHAGLRARRTHAAAAVLFVDLDRFKEVNDTYGHAAGDSLLTAVAGRLADLVRPGDTLARLYGDEFVLLCEDLRDRTDADALADRVRGAFDEPFAVGDTRLTISASVGIAFAGPGERVNPGLLGRADSAMYDAKRSQRPPRSHSRDSLDAPRPGTLRAELSSGLDRRRLSVDYQPIVSPDGALTGVEALVRWRGPEGSVPPATLLARAERGGLLGRLEGWVLQEGCREAVRWREMQPETGLRLHVNVSSRHVTALGFAREVLMTLDRTGLPRHALVLEVTEAGLAEGGPRALKVLRSLRAAGVRIALDDFGTGTSSLSRLQLLPVDLLKIDRSAWDDGGRSTARRPVLGALVALGRALGLEVVVEGVESDADRETTAAGGADLAQGFSYFRPLAVVEMDDLFSERRVPGSPVTVAGQSR